MIYPAILVIDPPLMNPYAPYLAVPLLTAALRRRGWRVRALDLSAESVDWLLSLDGLTRMEERLARGTAATSGAERLAAERALTVYPSAVGGVETAKETLRSLDALRDPERFVSARTILRNAQHCVSAAFPGLRFDLAANEMRYSVRSSRSVLDAVRDPDGNVYRWAFDRILPTWIDDPETGIAVIVVSADRQLIGAMTAARLLRERRPDVRIVLCGNYLTRLAVRWNEPHPLMRLADHIVAYETEESVPALCEAIAQDRPPAAGGLLVSAGDTVSVTPPQAVDLGELAPADFDDFPLGRYLAPGPVLPAFASRGCPWDCAFCAIPFASNRFRVRSADRIAPELEYLAGRHGSPHFFFVDELMSLHSLKSVSAALIERGSELFWFCETRFAAGLDADLARQLHRSGCRRIAFGLESAVPRVLDLMRKGGSGAAIEANIRDCLDAGIPLLLFSIVGFPGERPDEAAETIRFIERWVERSTTEYGLPYTRSGIGPFILDVHSPVGLDPRAYGVTLRPDPGEDLAMTVNYEVAGGLDQPAALALVADVAAETPDPSELGPDAIWFHQAHSKEVEEEIFLRTCYQAGFPGLRELPFGAWRADGGQRWVLAPDVSVRDAGSWRCEAGQPGPALVLYQARTDEMLAMPTGFEAAVTALRGETGCDERAWQEAAGSTGDARQVLGALIRFRFVLPASPANGDPAAGAEFGPAPAQPGESWWRTARFRPEWGVVAEFDHELRHGRLQSTVTGNTMLLGDEGQLIWVLCGEGLVLSERIAVSLGLPGSLATLRELAARMSRLGLIYAEAVPDAGGTAEKRLAWHPDYADAQRILGDALSYARVGLDVLAAALPAAARLTAALDGAQAAARTAALADPVLRSALNEQLGILVNGGQPEPSRMAPLLADAAAALSVAGEHGGLAADGPPPLWDCTPGPADDHLRALLEREIAINGLGTPVAIVPPSPGQGDVVAAGARLLTDALPALGPSILAHIKQVAVVEPLPGPGAGDAEGAALFESASFDSILGVVFVSPAAFDSAWRMAEILLHEGAHQKLNDLRLTAPLLRQGYDAAASPTITAIWNRPLPWNPNEWPVDRALAAFHTYVHLAVFFADAGVRLDELTGRYGPIDPCEVAESLERSLFRALHLGRALREAAGPELRRSGLRLVDWLLEQAESFDPAPAR